jgi:hypothetical protein
MEERQHLPDTDRLSVLTATILLAYAMLPFINLPDRSLTMPAIGILFVFSFNFATFTAILSAALAAAGTEWLLRGHPNLGSQSTFQHWLLPALTAWVIGVPLTSLEVGLAWWAVFAFGGLLLVLVLVAEYIAVDLYDARHAPATVVLTAVSFALFLILLIAIVAAGSRQYILLPTVAAALFLVTLRTLYLRLNGRWCFAWAAGIALVVTQVVAALHYWPVAPLRFGLLVLGLAYALTGMAGSIEEGRSWRGLWIEPVLMLMILWGLAFGANR